MSELKISSATGTGPSVLVRHAAWSLLLAFAMAVAYELYRATVMAGTSEHDSIRVFLLSGLPVYLVAGVVITGLFRGVRWAVPIALLMSVAVILISIFVYNPQIMLDRHPGLIDWFEDLVFTGLLFVAAVLLGYEILGYTLQSRLRR